MPAVGCFGRRHAKCVAALNNTTYKAAIYTFDYKLNTVQTLTTPTTAGTQIGNIQLMPVDHQNCVIINQCSGTDYGSEHCRRANEREQHHAGARRRHQPVRRHAAGGGVPRHRRCRRQADPEVGKLRTERHLSAPDRQQRRQVRCQQPLNTTACTTIKNRGIRIAVLYTEYLQLPTDRWYNSRIAQFNNPSSCTGHDRTHGRNRASPGLHTSVQDRRRHLRGADEPVPHGRHPARPALCSREHAS